MKKTILLCALLIAVKIQAQVPGTLDSTFGKNGIKTWTAVSGSNNVLREIRLQSDGKILAAGQITGSNLDMLLAKFKSNGTNDSTLQGSCFSMFDPFLGADDYIYCMDIMSDGKILLAGYQQGGMDNDVIVYKINTDGSIDNTWGTSGRVLIDAGANDVAMKIKELPDGKILIGGTKYSNNSSNMFLMRLTADGKPDATFSSDGISPVIFNGQTQGNLVDMEILPGGNIVVCGTISDGSLMQIGMAKVNTVGLGMPIFGVGSKVKFAMDGKNTQPSGMILTKTNKLVVCGSQEKAANDEAGVLLMLDTNGVFDNVFAAGKGALAYEKTTNIESEALIDLMELNNGQIFVVAAYRDVNSVSYCLGIMFDATGNIRLDFGNSGTVQHQAGSDYTLTGISMLLPQADGKVLIAGNVKNTITNKTEFLIYRMNMQNKAATGISSINTQHAIALYPNPATTSFSLRTDNKIEVVWMSDITGRAVSQWVGNNTNYSIPESLSNGLYYIKVKTPETITTIPLNINR